MKNKFDFLDCLIIHKELKKLVKCKLISVKNHPINNRFQFVFFNHPSKLILEIHLGSSLFLSENKWKAHKKTNFLTTLKSLLVQCFLDSVSLVPWTKVFKMEFRKRLDSNEQTMVVYFELFSVGNLVVTRAESSETLLAWNKKTKQGKKYEVPQNSFQFTVPTNCGLEFFDQSNKVPKRVLELVKIISSEKEEKNNPEGYAKWLNTFFGIEIDVENLYNILLDRNNKLVRQRKFVLLQDTFSPLLLEREVGSVFGLCESFSEVVAKYYAFFKQTNKESKIERVSEKKEKEKEKVAKELLNKIMNNQKLVQKAILAATTFDEFFSELNQTVEEILFVVNRQIRKNSSLNKTTLQNVAAEFPALRGDVKIDKIVIGGCAVYIRNEHVEVAETANKKENFVILKIKDLDFRVEFETYETKLTHLSLFKAAIHQTRQELYSVYCQAKEQLSKLVATKDDILRSVSAKQETKAKQRIASIVCKYQKINTGLRKSYWFEKFYWFLSSENILVLAGKDASSNEALFGKYTTKENDVFFHAEAHKSPAVIAVGLQELLREEKGAATVKESAVFAVLRSKSWKEGIGADVYWVLPEQVSTKAKAGEFAKKGAFIISGKRNYVRLDTDKTNRTAFGLGLVFVRPFPDKEKLINYSEKNALDSFSTANKKFFQNTAEKLSKKFRHDEKVISVLFTCGPIAAISTLEYKYNLVRSLDKKSKLFKKVKEKLLKDVKDEALKELVKTLKEQTDLGNLVELMEVKDWRQ